MDSDFDRPVHDDLQAPDGLWITLPRDFDRSKGQPAPHFRKSFQLAARPRKAVVRFCGLGYGELRVNGRKVSDDVLQPPFTRYDATVLFATYDVTDLLQEGENVVAAVLGNGMYNTWIPTAWDFEKAPWRGFPRLILSTVVETADGGLLHIRSDRTFKCSTGPILGDSLHGGELYDARLEQDGWDAPGFDDAGWAEAAPCRSPGGLLKPMDMEPARVVRRIPPVDRREIRPGVWRFDFGENLVGWASLRVSGPAGTRIALTFGERLDVDGGLHMAELDCFAVKEQFQRDEYILKGSGVEVWEPRFTYHGFQYAVLEGYPGEPGLDALTACEVHTDLPARGTFRSSDETLNWIHGAARLSTLGNYVGIPTDCPHREKNGWTGDAALSAEQMLMNHGAARAYRKWLRDIVDCQRPDGAVPGIVPTGGWGFAWGSGPAWDDALVVIPWYLYLFEGDVEALREFYEPIRRYVDFATRMAEDGLVDFGLGDWCPPVGGAFAYQCPTRVTDTAIHATHQRTLSRMAGVLGRREDEVRYAEAAAETRAAFRRAFVDESTGSVLGDCQTSYACALYHGTVEGETRRKVFDRLVGEVERCGRHIDCGILGAKYVPRVLSEGGRADLAVAIAVNPTFPGWGHWKALGATTLWETWNGDSSLNHHMFSDIDGWFYQGLAGIQPEPDRPGFRHTEFRPAFVEALSHVEARHDAPVGTVSCGWRSKDGWITVTASVPDGCTGTLHLPAGWPVERVDLDLHGAIEVVAYPAG